MCTPPTVPDPCEGIPADGVDRTVVTSGGALGINNLVRVGMTLSQVRSNLPQNVERGASVAVAAGPGIAAAGLAVEALGLPVFGVVYCPQRLGVVYRDGGGTGGAVGTLSPDDVVIRITPRRGFSGSTDSGLALGDTRLDVQNANGTAVGYAQGASWPQRASDLYPQQGVSFFLDGPALTNLLETYSVHRALDPTEPLLPTPANAPINLQLARLGTGMRTLDADLFGGGTQLPNVPARMGEPDVRGRVQLGNTNLNYVAYLQAGVVAVAPDPLFGMPTVVSILLLPPFGGRYTPSNGVSLGVGSSRAEWDNAGLVREPTGSLGAVPVERYKVNNNFGAKQTGVIFTRESDCVERAAVVILNYIQN